MKKKLNATQCISTGKLWINYLIFKDVNSYWVYWGYILVYWFTGSIYWSIYWAYWGVREYPRRRRRLLLGRHLCAVVANLWLVTCERLRRVATVGGDADGETQEKESLVA